VSKSVFQFHWYREPDERVLAWIRANNLDPHLIPVDSQAIMEDGNLTVTEITGNKKRNGEGMETIERTVPLLSPPSEHGL